MPRKELSMAEKVFRVVYYLNQFFGQEGGEEKAQISFLVKKGPIGPGSVLQKLLGAKGEVVATIICGDNYFAENAERAAQEGLELVKSFAPDLFFAGPAFEAGRYGIACGALCQRVQEQLAIPAITGAYVENPGVELYRRHTYICKTERSAAKMVESLTSMLRLGLKLVSNEVSPRVVSGENISRPEEDGYFPRGIIKNEFVEKTAAERGVEMLLAKLKGQPFQTETQIPKMKVVHIPPPIRKDLSSCEVALVTDGGIVPQGNPDGFKTRVNSAWGAYDLDRILPEDGSPEKIEIVHTGYSNVYVKENPSRLVPADVLRDLEKERIIGKLHRTLYSTTGNAGAEIRMSEIGGLIAGELKKKGVDAAILTST